MRSLRSRRLAVVLAVAVLAVAAAGTALAVSVSQEDVPQETTVGDRAQANVTVTDLYEGGEDEWTLAAETELTDTRWTVRYVHQNGTVVRQIRETGVQGIRAEGISSPVAEVQVEVTGEVPSVDQYSYPEQNTFTILELRQETGATSSTIETWTPTHETEASRQARTALDEAKSALDAANASGANVEGAAGDFASARQAYRNGEFSLATQLARDARDAAQQAQEDAESGGGGPPLALIAGAVVVLLVVVVVALYFYRQRQQQGTRLR